MSKVIVKRPNEKAQIVDFCNGNEWKKTEEEVLRTDYGCFDMIHLSNKPYELTMWLDDEGALYDDKVLNFHIHTNNPFYPIQPIYGNVVVTRGHLVDDDIEYEDVTDDDLRYFNSILIGV